jgi:hypothetical protein
MKAWSSLAVLIAALAVTAPASAVDEVTKEWLVSIGESQQNVDRQVSGVRQRGVWVARQGHCSRIGIIVGSTDNPERIENYRVCGTRIVDVTEPAPPPSTSGLFRAALDNAVRSAVLAGEYIAKAEGFEIRSVRAGDPDAKGCADVETTISNGLLLSGNRVTHACP